MSVDKVTADDKKHEGDVTSIIFHGEILFSAGSDGKVKVLVKFLVFPVFSLVLLIDLGFKLKLHERTNYS